MIITSINYSLPSLRLRPPTSPASHHVAYLATLADAQPRDLGGSYNMTPLSTFGPACSGSLTALCRLPVSRTLTVSRFKLGSVALTAYPFKQPGKTGLFHYTDEGGIRRPHSLHEIASGRANLNCPLCDQMGLDTWHLVNECTHPRLVATRTALAASCTCIKDALARLLRDQQQHALLSELDTAWNNDTLTTSGPATEFILYRLICGTPWPARQPYLNQLPIASLPRVLGRIFDSINLPPYKLRDLADSWMRWSCSAITTLANECNAAIGQLVPHTNDNPDEETLSCRTEEDPVSSTDDDSSSDDFYYGDSNNTSDADSDVILWESIDDIESHTHGETMDSGFPISWTTYENNDRWDDHDLDPLLPLSSLSLL